jgi:methylmalonyl-CoA/ethylmalonyl-CoA epimerase
MKMSKREILTACGCFLCGYSLAALGAAAGSANAQDSQVATKASDSDRERKSSARGERRDGSGLPDLHHIALIVTDRDRSLAKLQDGLGFGRSYVFDSQFPKARVSSGVTGFNLRIGFTWMGNTLLELLQPVDDRSPHATFLKERGEGMHHLGFLVRSIDRELDAMAATRGGQRPPLLVDAMTADDVSWCYIEGEYANGAVIELIERSPQSEEFFKKIYQATGGRMPD